MTHEIIMQLRYASDQMKDKLGEQNLLTRAADELEKLSSQMAEMKADLDRTRRQWCAMIASGDTRVQDPRRCLTQASMIAASNGWDCMHEIIDQQPDRLLYPRANERIV